MSEINIILIEIVCVCVCVCVEEGSYEGCMCEVKFVQLGYMIIC